MNCDATIFALASAAGKAGVAIFRISGTRARNAIEVLCHPSLLPAPRYAAMRRLRDPTTGETIDHVLVLYFAGPSSFTGQDVVEFHAHGGRAVCDAVIGLLQRLPGFRMAEPGEFTRRAFENGKMDLTEAEAIADLVHAETEAQRKQALRQLEGALGKLYNIWRENLSRCLAYVEAAIDFVEDELPADLIENQRTAIKSLRGEISAHLDDNRRGERLRDGFTIAIIGAPNAGKSSLLNALAQRDAAIVSATPGTTRDIIDVHVDIGGYPVTFSDTAGLRDSGDEIEREGIRRAVARATQADLNLLVIDSAAPNFDVATKSLVDARTIIVMNKSDLATGTALPLFGSIEPIILSARTGNGMQDLLHRLSHEISRLFDAHSTPPLTRARHRAALEECVEHLDRALSVAQTDMYAEDIRLAMRALGRITGRFDVEDLLDVIFRDFCIGK